MPIEDNLKDLRLFGRRDRAGAGRVFVDIEWIPYS